METHAFLLQLVFILLAARCLGELAARFKIPSVIGELSAGILLGPSILALIDITPPIHLLAQIGVILLLFEVGMETDLGRLVSAGTKSFAVAIVGVLLPLAFGFSLSYYAFHLPLLTSLFIGGTLTATSIGITLRVLKDLKKQNSHEAQIILGAAVLDDIIGIVLLAMLYEFSLYGDIDLWKAGKVLIFIALFFFLSPFMIKFLAHVLQKWEEKSEIPGLLPACVVAFILLFSWLAHQVGAPEILGGFAAGLALSKSFSAPFLHKTPEFSVRIEEQMKPIIHLFTPIFFVSVGLSLDFQSIDWTSSSIWALTLSLFLLAVLGKLLSGFSLRKESFLTQLSIGTAMAPRGEVGLIFANLGLMANIFENSTYASLILVIALTTLLAPFALRSIYGKSP